MSKKIKDNGIGNVRTTVVFTNEANLGENMNLPLKQFSSVKDTISFLIDMYKEEGIDNNERGEIEAIETLFKEKVTEINVYYLVDGTGIELFFRARKKAEKEEISNQLKLLIGSRTFEKVINQIYPAFFHFVQERQNNLKKEKELEEREAELNKREEEVEKLHKQPRGYLKTTAKLVGKTTDEKTLFSLPDVDVKVENGGNFLREVISRNTAILGNYLLQLWQQNGGEELVINNLSPIAEIMGNSNYEIKIYLLYLGGYVYPIIDKDKDGLTLTTEQLFKIKFRYSSKVSAKYKGRKYPYIGSGLTKFIKDEPIDSITIEPSPLFIKALEGKGLGNVLVVNDKFIKLALSLTDIAYKIFTYSASNKPSQKIAENNLVKHLGLEKQIKTQGRPRIRATILKGLQELKDKEHIKNYSYEEATGMYLFTYSDRYVRHQELKKGKKLNL